LLGAIAAIALAAPAFAADLPARTYDKAPVVAARAAYDWSGFYVGGTAGGAFGSFDPSTSTTLQANPSYFGASSVAAVNAAGAQRIKPAGFTGGFETGYNWQAGSFVVGLEGDVEYLGLKGSAATTGGYPCCAPATFTVTSSASTTWLATARARAGIAANDWLFFATGGAAFTNIKTGFGFSDNCGLTANCNAFFGAQPNGAEASSFSSMKTGFAVGGGVEKAIGPNWTVKAEYLHVGFGKVTGTGTLTGADGFFNIVSQSMTHSYDLKADIVRLGVNYKFGGPAARY
jgi:outer membrane immunogenic protein